MRHMCLSAVVLIGLVLLLSSNAHAGLTFCNKTNETIYVSVAEWHGDCFLAPCEEHVQGWWKIDPGACKTPIGGNLNQDRDGEDDYFYWAHNDSSTWAGDTAFCVDPVNAFNYKDDQASQCGDDAKRKFKSIDRQKYSDFTLNLT